MQFLTFSLGLFIMAGVVGLLLSLGLRLWDLAGNKVCDMYGVSANPAQRAFWLQTRFERLVATLIGAAVLVGIVRFVGPQ
jgi:hypothetical protein